MSVAPVRGVRVLVVMGVSGSGKSTVGRDLAGRLHLPFEEGDLLHPPQNVAKMASGHPLTDADREPWLRRVADWIDGAIATGRGGVITCSALKRRYRDELRRPQVTFIYLAVPVPELRVRLQHREGHFMPLALLDSQLADLEPPEPDENAVTVDVDGPPGLQAQRIVDLLGGPDGPARG